MAKEIQHNDMCICCGKPVPEGRMVCYVCETGGNTTAPSGAVEQSKGIKKLLDKIKERKNDPGI